MEALEWNHKNSDGSREVIMFYLFQLEFCGVVDSSTRLIRCLTLAKFGQRRNATLSILETGMKAHHRKRLMPNYSIGLIS